MNLTNLFLSFGLTRDSFVWFWGRLVSGSLLLLTGLVPLDVYIGPGGQKALTVAAVVVLWLSGKFDASTLPGAKK